MSISISKIIVWLIVGALAERLRAKGHGVAGINFGTTYQFLASPPGFFPVLNPSYSTSLQVGIEQEVPIGSAGSVPTLVEIKQRSTETLGSPMQAFSGDWQVSIPTEWNKGGRLFIRQSYPLPCTILALVPEVSVGD